MPSVSTHLWFDSRAREAAETYVALIPGSRITNVNEWPEGSPMAHGDALSVEFELGGVPYVGLNGGAANPLTPAVSIFVLVDDQAEVDRLWDALTADGGEPGRCGWLVDRFGLSWQIVPRRLGELLQSPDADASARAMQAMLGMSRLDIAALEDAARG